MKPKLFSASEKNEKSDASHQACSNQLNLGHLFYSVYQLFLVLNKYDAKLSNASESSDCMALYKSVLNFNFNFNKAIRGKKTMIRW